MDALAAATLCRELMNEHGFGSWSFSWMNRKRTYGWCSYSKQTISLSRPYVEINEERAVRDTILHEIAHAKAGPRAGHGWRWKLIARSLGAVVDAGARREFKQAPPMKWERFCPSCGISHTISRRSRKPYACGKCCRRHGVRWAPEYVLQYRLATGIAQNGGGR